MTSTLSLMISISTEVKPFQAALFEQSIQISKPESANVYFLLFRIALNDHSIFRKVACAFNSSFAKCRFIGLSENRQV